MGRSSFFRNQQQTDPPRVVFRALTGDVNASLTQLALDFFTLPFEARIGLAVHSVRPQRLKRIDTWATIIIAQPASNALGFHVKAAPAPCAL